MLVVVLLRKRRLERYLARQMTTPLNNSECSTQAATIYVVLVRFKDNHPVDSALTYPSYMRVHVNAKHLSRHAVRRERITAGMDKWLESVARTRPVCKSPPLRRDRKNRSERQGWDWSSVVVCEFLPYRLAFSGSLEHV